MKRIPLFSMVMMAAVLGAAACGDRNEEEPVVTEGPAVEDTTGVGVPEVAPIDPRVTEGAIIMDTSAVGTIAEPDSVPRP